MGFFGEAGSWIVGKITDQVKEGVESFLTGKSVWEIRREREDLRRKLAMDAAADADLDRYVAEQTAEYHKIVQTERARGNRNHPEFWMEHGRLGDYRAVCVFNSTSKRGRMDIYYGGAGSNPLNNIDHGHIVLQDGTVTHWLEPVDPKYMQGVDLRYLSEQEVRAIKKTRNRLY
ncbi:MAG: hypothetical protein PVI21_00765 [Candidatus Woesebacteria bacterium]|jgi:hypothetical protein